MVFMVKRIANKNWKSVWMRLRIARVCRKVIDAGVIKPMKHFESTLHPTRMVENSIPGRFNFGGNIRRHIVFIVR